MDFLAKLTGRHDEPALPPIFEQLEELVARVQGERQKLETVLSLVRAEDVAVMPRALEQLERRVAALTQQLEAASGRADQLERSTATAHALQARLTTLEASVRSVEAVTDETVQRAEEIRGQHAALQELVSAAQSTVTRLEAVAGDARFAHVAEQMPGLTDDCARVIEQQGSLRTELGQLQTLATAIVQDAAAAGEVSKRAHDEAAAAAERLASVQRKLEAVSRFEAATFDATGQLQTLNALAEHVALKVKALENQQQTTERALVDSRRVGEMVWEMNVQIAKLGEGSTLAASVEETLGRLERLHLDITGRLETATRERTQFGETVEHQRRASAELLQTLQSHLERLAFKKNEMDALQERLEAAQTGLAQTEGRLEALSTTGRTLSDFGEKLDSLASRIEGVATQVSAIEQKQPFLDTLEQRLDDVDQEARRATGQLEGLARRRQELAAITGELDTCEATYAQARKLGDELRQEREQIAQFFEQAREFTASAPAAAAAIDDLQSRVVETEACAGRALAMRRRIDELATRLDLLTPRLQVVDEVQARLGRLHELSAEIDQKLAAQLNRQAEVERARVFCDGLATQVSDAQQKLQLLEAAHCALAAVPNQIATLQADLTGTRRSLASLQRDEQAVVAQERRLAALGHSAGVAVADITSRIQVLQTIQTELSGVDARKDDVYKALEQVQASEREAFERLHEAHSLLEQLTGRWKQLDERRGDLVAVERTMDVVEARMATIDRLGEGLNAKIAAISERDGIVEAVRQELDTIHEVARRSREDLAVIADQRAAIVDAREDVERVAEAVAATTEKLAGVERRSAAVDHVRRKADAVARLLDDVHVTLNTVGEQKAMIDHVGEMVARLDGVLEEARGTTKALQAERKLAQRIVANVQNIHARAGAEIRQVG
jgi:DNA repair exonuclease SbcCD ATPase subunit